MPGLRGMPNNFYGQELGIIPYLRGLARRVMWHEFTKNLAPSIVKSGTRFPAARHRMLACSKIDSRFICAVDKVEDKSALKQF